MKAQAARDRGMTQAIEHAERIDDTFGERAYAWIVSYAQTHRQFISEQCTAAAAAAGIVSPADDRAWGAPFHRAARAGVIRKIGFGVSQRRHLSPTPLWASCAATRSGKA
jgi:hypothetical protein